MPLLAYAGLSAPKRRHDGRSSNHVAQNNILSRSMDKKRSSTSSAYVLDDARSISKSTENCHDTCVASRQRVPPHTADDQRQSPLHTCRHQQSPSRSHFQSSNNTSVRIYNHSHPHRENHQRLSSKRQAPYASAPSSPWKSSNPTKHGSSYLCSTLATQARIDGTLSRSQIIQRDDVHRSVPSLEVKYMSTSSNGDINLSGVAGKIGSRYSRTSGVCSPQKTNQTTAQSSPLSRSQEENSPRISPRMFAINGGLTSKQQWLASGLNGAKSSSTLTNGCLPSNLMQQHKVRSSSDNRSPYPESSPPLPSSSPYRKSSQYGSSDKSYYTNSPCHTKRDSRSSERSSNSPRSSHFINTPSNERSSCKRRSYRASDTASPGMSKSDSITYKEACSAQKCPAKRMSGCKGDNPRLAVQSTSANTETYTSNLGSKMTSSTQASSNGTSTLLSSSFMNKVR